MDGAFVDLVDFGRNTVAEIIWILFTLSVRIMGNADVMFSKIRKPIALTYTTKLKIFELQFTWSQYWDTLAPTKFDFWVQLKMDAIHFARAYKKFNFKNMSAEN